MIWKTKPDIATLNQLAIGNATSHLGINFTEFGDNFLRGTMPVDARTKQPYGLLHGGASVLLAETVGSMAANLCVEENEMAVGLDINANHMRPVTQGMVTATATAVSLGRTIQVWQIDIVDDNQKAICTSRLTIAVTKRR